MKKSIILLMMVFAIPTWAQQGVKNFIDQNYLEVTGTAQKEIIPDIIYIRIIVSDKDPDVPKPLEKAEEQIKQILVRLGIDIQKELEVDDISEFGNKYLLKKDHYETRKSFKVIVHDATTANKLFREMENMGVYRVDLEGFTHSQIEKFRLETKTEALKAAKFKSETLASAIGQNTGRALFIQELNTGEALANMPGIAQNRLMSTEDYDNMGFENKGAPDTPFKKLYLSASFLVRYELK